MFGGVQVGRGRSEGVGERLWRMEAGDSPDLGRRQESGDERLSNGMEERWRGRNLGLVDSTWGLWWEGGSELWDRWS